MTTTNKDIADDLLLDPKDPHYKKPRQIEVTNKSKLQTIKPIIIKKPAKKQRFNPVTEYFKAMIEVILA